MFAKKIIAFDIDGTLTPRLDWIDPKVVQYLQNLTDNGWQLALLTGRVFSFASQILQYLPFPYLLAVQNGADIIEMPSKKPIQRNYLSSKILPKIEEVCKELEEDFIIYAGIDEGDFCYFRKNQFSSKMLSYLKIVESKGAAPWKESDFSFEKEISFPLVKCFGKEEELLALNPKWKDIKEVEVSFIRDPIDRSLFMDLITHPKANKGAVIQFLREHFQADLVIAAGDDRNDLKMLKEADVAIAIETAPKEVLQEADIIARPAKDLGIIEAVEKAIEYANR